MSTFSGQNVDNFVEKVVFLCLHEYDFFCNYMRVEHCRKKGREKILILCVAASVLIAYCLATPFVVNAMRDAKAQRPIIVVDAGHGGADGGVKGAKTGVEEKTLNLIIANLLGEMLEGCGFDVVYTRRNDVMHTFEGVKDNKKRADMFRRGQIVNDVKPLAVVSIHMNFYSMPTRRGAQVFFAKSNAQSRRFANALQDCLNSEINAKEGGREYSALCAEKYLLECSPYPTAIVECGFLSNYADEINLQTTSYRVRIAAVLCQAVARYAFENARL